MSLIVTPEPSTTLSFSAMTDRRINGHEIRGSVQLSVSNVCEKCAELYCRRGV
jgi:hypothetical protein